MGSQWKIFSSVGLCLEKLLCGSGLNGFDPREPEGREPGDTGDQVGERRRGQNQEGAAELERSHKQGNKTL